MDKYQTRRAFLRTAPLAAVAVGLPLSEKLALAATGAQAPTPVPFQLYTAEKLAGVEKDLGMKPGDNNLFSGGPTLPLIVVMTVEKAKAAKEFEYHESRDHVIQIIEGSTIYHVGGTPQTPRKIAPGEWLAPGSEGATTYTLHKGDMLVIPRGTPHKRNTEVSVTLILMKT